MDKHTALIIIDMINKMDFKGSRNLLNNTKTIIKPLLNLKYQVKKLGIPVIYVNDNYGLWREDVNELMNECKKGIGREILYKLRPEKDDFFIIKPKHSGFYGTQLDILLKSLEVENLILTGIAGEYCVLFTVFDAYMREFNLWVPSDCTASETNKAHEKSLWIMNRSMFANINPSEETELRRTPIFPN